MPQAFTSWEAIYETLRAAFPKDRYHMGEALLRGSPRDGDGRIGLELEGGSRSKWTFWFAPTARSRRAAACCRTFAPSYAGYVAWRGTIDEAAAPAVLARFFDDAFTFSEARSGGHILTYFIPGTAVGQPPAELGLVRRRDERGRRDLARGSLGPSAQRLGPARFCA